MGAFSRVWLVPRALQAVDLSIIWPGNGPRFYGSNPWILVPERRPPLVLRFPAEPRRPTGLIAQEEVHALYSSALRRMWWSCIWPKAKLTTLYEPSPEESSGRRWDLWQGHLSCNSSWGSVTVRDIHTDAPARGLRWSGSCALVRPHGSGRSGAQSLCQPVSVILHGVLWERGSSGLSGEDVCVQTPGPLLRGSETRKYTERVPQGTQNPESTSSLVQ